MNTSEWKLLPLYYLHYEKSHISETGPYFLFNSHRVHIDNILIGKYNQSWKNILIFCLRD